MTPHQRIGQLFMVGVVSTSVSGDDLRQLQHYDIGNVTLLGHDDRGVAATARITTRLRRATTQQRVDPFIATDQEGGEVQDLTGPGFSTIPTALQQGRLSPKTLRADAAAWGGQLAHAGLTTDLAPVCDVVPARRARRNQPIGRYDREYGHSPARVTSHALAFARGLAGVGITATLKHFPGLGRATGNTDVEVGVTDPTTRHDAYLRPFEKGIAAGAPIVMVSTATYPHIDPDHPAVFSPTVMQGMLRGDADFRGLIVSDSLSTVSLEHTPAARRAARFLAAGGDMPLVSDPADTGPMVQGVRGRAVASAQFAAMIHRAVLRVLTLKASTGLLAG
jgi:beta-N-acetylhexosaminidase